ncbi:class I SAM-dependent methyltransferase [Comamonas sp. GB3 AK4-5]|uniref:class I SAM-dependent methyltransferase n=1 Tax=Comamonas sp. GB3 AK4-5 TaxID=3231487 RepID=UPI00351DC763
MSNELDAISERYERRKHIAGDRYARLNPAVNAVVQERQTALIKLFAQQGIRDLSAHKVLEVGCGSGANLLELVQLGATPANLVGNELLPGRLDAARARLPQDVALYAGDASKLPLPDASFDMVYQSTVFSSILDDDLQQALAQKMWSLVRPGGGVLWYDFTFNNPRNPDVRGVTVSRIRELFPQGVMSTRRVTLAPPITRGVVKVRPTLYGVFNALPFLRTHVLCWIQKNDV